MLDISSHVTSHIVFIFLTRQRPYIGLLSAIIDSLNGVKTSHHKLSRVRRAIKLLNIVLEGVPKLSLHIVHI